MSVTDDQFYTRLPARKGSISDLLVKANLFQAVPGDWYIVMTDIKNSTLAVQAGRHQDVNLIATGSIVSVLNIAFGMHLTVPFFFGGDGATFMVPHIMIGKVMKALSLFRKSTQDNFGLELRTSMIPVEEVYAKGHELSIAKFHSSETFSIPVVLGDGLSYAEQLMKEDNAKYDDPSSPADEPDLRGMQCRWDKIAPPEDKEEVVTLLVIAGTVAQQPVALGKVMILIDRIYGSPQKRQPISKAKLKLKTSFSRLGMELQAKLGKVRLYKLLETWLVTLLGFIYFRTSRGQTYLQALIEKSDTLVIDGRINTVISGTLKQRKELQENLDQLEAKGEIIYGLHISNASIMSCYVRDHKDGHIHFVDGAEGGYTQAAKMLKIKWKGRGSPVQE